MIGVGADFLGSWVRPCSTPASSAQFRQGRPGVRGLFWHAESRLSPTAATADRWLPVRPGTEPAVSGPAGPHPARFRRGAQHRSRPRVPPFAADVHALLATCGLEERRVREAARMLAESDAPLVLAGRVRGACQLAPGHRALPPSQLDARQHRQARRCAAARGRSTPRAQLTAPLRRWPTRRP